MAPKRSRHHLVPNANNPQLLLRLIGLVAAGLRRPMVLAEILEVELRTVHYYTQAGEWLGLLSTDGEVHLSPRGMQLAFAEPGRETMCAYAEAVWRNPLVISLMTARERLPDTPTIATFIQEHDRSLSMSTATRRASAVRGLISPALRLRPASNPTEGMQIELPFAVRTGASSLPQLRPVPRKQVDMGLGRDGNPEVYWRLLEALLDHGELIEGQVLALLEDSGAVSCDPGSYIEMALQRGDAVQIGDRLVIAPKGVAGRRWVRSARSIALTEPGYRAHLSRLVGRDGAAPSGAHEHYAAWDRRFFGVAPTVPAMAEALDAHRAPTDQNIANSSGEPGPAAPFLECCGRTGLWIAFPSALVALAGGVSAVNALMHPVELPDARLPSPCDVRLRVHGGLLHPREQPIPLLASAYALRLQAISRAPALSLMAALLLLSRRSASPLRIDVSGSETEIRWGEDLVGPLVPTLMGFANEQGWRVSLPTSGGLQGRMLVALCRSLGLASRVGRRLVMAEAIFVRLQEQADGRRVYRLLIPLADRFAAWFDNISLGRSVAAGPPGESEVR